MGQRLRNEDIPEKLRTALEMDVISWQEAHGLADMYQRILQEEDSDTVCLPEWLKEANLKVFLLELPPPVLMLM